MPELYDWLQTSAITPLIGQNRNMYSRQEPLNFNLCTTNQKQEHLNMEECTSRQGASATGELSPNITAQHAEISVRWRKHGEHTTNVLCTLWRGPTYEDDVMMCYS